MKGAHVVETRYPEPNGLQSSSLSPAHGAPEVVGGTNGHGFGHERTVDEIEASKTGWFAYFKTKDFYIVLVLGYVLSENCFQLSWRARADVKSTDRFWHFVLPQRIHFQACSSGKERPFRHSRLSSITFF